MLTPVFSSNRAVRQYTEEYYIPAAKSHLARTSDDCKAARGVVAWRDLLDRKWANLRFGDVKVEEREGAYRFVIHVYLDGLDPDAVCVQLYAEGADGNGPFRGEMVRGQPLVGAINGYVYALDVPATRPAGEYTPRIVPSHAGVSVPFEVSRILWQR